MFIVKFADNFFLQHYWERFKMLQIFSIICLWNLITIWNIAENLSLNNNAIIFPQQDVSRLLMNISFFIYFYCLAELLQVISNVILLSINTWKARSDERTIHIIQIQKIYVEECVKCDKFGWEFTAPCAQCFINFKWLFLGSQLRNCRHIFFFRILWQQFFGWSVLSQTEQKKIKWNINEVTQFSRFTIYCIMVLILLFK